VDGSEQMLVIIEIKGSDWDNEPAAAWNPPRRGPAPGEKFTRCLACWSMGHVDRAGQLAELATVESRQVAVVLVDLQNDFCRPSRPGEDPEQTQANADAARRANDFAGDAARLGLRVLYSRQIIDPARLTARQRRWKGNPRLCVAGSTGAELFIEPVAGSRVVRKYRFDLWQSEEFVQALSDWDIGGLIIGGVELICCVLHAVLGAEERGYSYVVPLGLVSGMRSSEQVANRAVRDYLRAVHPTVERAADLLSLWQATDSV
jgi:nicotinamidase-related amidase